MSDANAYYLLGSYTDDADGTGAGISLLRQDDAGTLRLVQATGAPSPSFLALHPTAPIVYAASETTGTLLAFRRSGEFGLAQLGGPIEAGEAVCHVIALPTGSAVVGSCYGDGRVVSVPLGEGGSFAADPILSESSVDPYASPVLVAEEPGEDALTALAVEAVVSGAFEPRPSRAHASVMLPDGRLATTDLGHDAVRVWRIRGAELLLDHTVVLPLGIGPRHLAVHPSGHLHVVTEYSNEVFTLALDGTGHWHVVSSVVAPADGVHEGDAAAEISVAASLEQLHMGIRGSDRIATLAVTGDGSVLRSVADVECGGSWPRHHLEAGGLLHVANQLSDAVATFRLDERTGVPSKLLGTLETGSPTCLLRV